MAVTVQAMDVYRVDVPMRRFRHAAADRDQAQSIVVCVKLSDGRCGWGQTLPRPYVTGESIDSVQADLREVIWPAMAGCGPVAALSRWPGRAGERRIPAARCAAELAIIDLIGMEAAMGPAPADGGSLRRCRVSGVIGSSEPDRTARMVRLMRWAGLRDFKLKMGLDEALDQANLRATVDQLGRGLRRGRYTLRVDANGDWAEKPLDRIRALDGTGVCVVEQPKFCSATELVELARVSPLPLMADESLLDLDDARVLASETRVWWNIRISKNGGLGPALELARLAHQRGVGVSIGCMVGESGLLSAAQRRLLEYCPQPRFVEGNYGRLLLREDLTTTCPRWGYGGRLSRLRGPGLGVRMDVARLARLGQCVEQLSVEHVSR